MSLCGMGAYAPMPHKLILLTSGDRRSPVQNKGKSNIYKALAPTNLNSIQYTHTPWTGVERRTPMRAEKQDVIKRLNYIEGHLKGIRKMVDEDKYCVDILRQTYAVRKAIEKLESLILENHLASCVPEGIREGREEAVIAELLQLYNLAGNR